MQRTPRFIALRGQCKEHVLLPNTVSLLSLISDTYNDNDDMADFVLHMCATVRSIVRTCIIMHCR